MSWATVQQSVKEAISLCLMKPADSPCVEWENRATAARFTDPYLDDSLMCDLRMGAVIQKGRGEKRRSMDEQEQKLKTSYGGYRLFTVTCYVTTMSQEPGQDAQSYAGLIRTRLRRDDVHAILKEGKVALVTIGGNFNADFSNAESRMESAAILEIRFSTSEWDVETSGTLGWIEVAKGAGSFENGVDGDPIDTVLDTSQE